MLEQLSDHGVPSLVMDIKGDVSGIGIPGDKNNASIQKRAATLRSEYTPRAFPVEFLSISEEPGSRIRTTVIELGPLLCAKML